MVPHLEQSMQLLHAQLCPSLFSGLTSVSTHKRLEMRRPFGLESVQVLAGIGLISFTVAPMVLCFRFVTKTVITQG